MSKIDRSDNIERLAIHLCDKLINGDARLPSSTWVALICLDEILKESPLSPIDSNFQPLSAIKEYL